MTKGTFKITQETKRMMTNILDIHARGEFKRAMINAEQTYIDMRHRKSRGKDEVTPKTAIIDSEV